MVTATALNDSDDLLDLQSVTKAYRLETKQFLAVKDINLRIKPGEFVCLLGPSGCGKSTLAADHCRIERRYFRRGLISRAAVERRQSLHDDCLSNVCALSLAHGARERGNCIESARGVPAESRKERALKLIDVVGLDGFESAISA